jgi:hypothetical protein
VSALATDKPRKRVYGLIAEFESPAAIMHAAERVKEAGYKWWDCCTPFPVHGLDKVMGIRPTILPILVFFIGMSGTATAFALQSFTNSSDLSLWALVPVHGYPYLISGKPFMSLPAFIPVMFELTILFAALASVGLMFGFNGLPRLHHPLFKSRRFRRATDDRFFVVIEARDPHYFHARTQAFLESLDPISVETVED